MTYRADQKKYPYTTIEILYVAEKYFYIEFSLLIQHIFLYQ